MKNKLPRCNRSGLSRALMAIGLAATATVGLLQAQTTSEASEKVIQLDPFTVNNSADKGYQASQSVSGSRFVTEIKNSPYSLAIIPENLLADTNAITMEDALRYATGAVATLHPYNDNTILFQRGFETNLLLRDGVRRVGPFDTTGVERIEVLNGPASVLFGITNPGGTVNYVPKKPLARAQANLSQTVGTWNTMRTQVDIGGPVGQSGSLFYRLPASYYTSDRWFSYSDIEKFAASPSFLWQISPQTKALFSLEYARSNETPIGPFLGVVVEAWYFPLNLVPRDFTVQIKQSFSDVETVLPSLTLTHGFNDHWTLRNNTAFYRHSKSHFSAGRGATRLPGFPVFRQAQLEDLVDTNFQNNLDLMGKFDTAIGGLTVVASHEFQDNNTDINQKSGFGVGAVVPPDWTLLNPSTWNYNEDALSGVTPTVGTSTKFKSTAYSAMGQLETMNGHLFLTAGMRHDATETTLYNHRAKTVEKFEPGKTSGQVGALYRVNNQVGVYANYSTSFNPISQTLLDINQNPFNPVPIEGVGKEAGLKLDLLGGRITQTLAFYEVELKNIVERLLSTASSSAAIQYSVQSGLQRSRGYEYSLNAAITDNWYVVAGYAYTNAKVVSNDSTPANVGQTLTRSYRDKVNLFTRYSFSSEALKGLYVGGGYLYISEAPYGTGILQALMVPANRNASALVGYETKIGAYRWDFRLNVDNVFDADYVTINFYRSAPRNFMLTAKVDF